MKRLTLTLMLLAAAPLAEATAQNVSTKRITFGLQNPGFMAQAPGDSTRLFVFERRQGIRIVKNGVPNPGYFLDLSSELGTNEAGTSFCFHPDYQNNGKFYVLYMDTNQVSHLAQYTVTANPEVADPASRVQIMGPEPQPGNIHNWDCIKFGPDGMLYGSFGDGILVTNNVDNPSQDMTNTFGTIVRLDVDLPFPHVPADNPFVGQVGVDERIWISGLRQPWRFSFDPMNDDLYIGDVGKGSWEEINILNAGNQAGKNMGWRCHEGTSCTNYAGGGCLSCGDPSYVPPVFEYPHDNGRCAIIGGEVYRGSGVPSLFGCYIYADFCTAQFWSFKWDGAQITDHVEITSMLMPDVGNPVDFPTSFATDHDGELYILSNAGGEIYKIVEDTCNTANYCTSTVNTAGTAATISATGSTQISSNDFTLRANGLLPNKVGLFFYGPNQIQVPFGEGFRCVGGSIFRMNPPDVANGSGFVQRPIDYATPPQPAGQILAGSTWNFQYWYRDSTAPGLFNLTDGLEASFCP